MKHLSAFYLMLLLLLGTQLFAQNKKRDAFWQQLSHIHTQQEIAADVDYLGQALEVAHPDLYRYISKPELDSMLVAIKAKGGQLTLKELYIEVSQVASTIGCGHLQVDYPKKLAGSFYKQSYFPPLVVYMHDTLALVKMDMWGSKAYENYRVLAINHTPIDSLTKRLHVLLSRDGYTQAATNWMLQKGWFNELYMRYWPDSTHLHYTLQAKTDTGWAEPYAVVLPSIGYKDFKHKLRSTKRKRVPPQLTLKYDSTTHTAILTVLSFDPMTIARGRQKFNKFIQQAFWRIYQTQPDQLIIDLRDNAGGSTFYPEMLIGYLSQEPFSLYSNVELRYRLSSEQPSPQIKTHKAYRRIEKKSLPGKNGNRSVHHFQGYKLQPIPNPYKGNVYVMVNGGTYSAASELACYLKDHMEAIVVGTETGGSCDPISAGMDGIATLPNSGIIVHIPLFTLYKDINAPRQPGCGLKPDIAQPHYLPTDTIADPELTELLKIIEGQQVVGP